jgi:hypothetical protein
MSDALALLAVGLAIVVGLGASHLVVRGIRRLLARRAADRIVRSLSAQHELAHASPALWHELDLYRRAKGRAKLGTSIALDACAANLVREYRLFELVRHK